MWNENISKRTFGFELEFADSDKTKIVLPEGYKWTDNNLTLMNNSDGSAVTHNGQFGGEINTRPYLYNKEDLKELKNFINLLKETGGYLMWNEGFDAHFYVRDLGLDVIKRIFALSYYVAKPIKEIFDFPEWWDTKYLAPTPTYDVVKKALATDSEENFIKIFCNGSDRGHIRYWLNCVPIEKIGTIEFRIFNSSWDFEKTLETIKFMYSFVDYAYMNEDIEKYIELNSIEKCLQAFNIDRDKVPGRHKPLLWAAEMSDNTTVVGEMFKKSQRMLSYISKSVKQFDTVRVVNSFYMDIEQVVFNKMVVYTKEYFIYVLYKAIRGEIKELSFNDEYRFLDISTDKESEIIATLFLFNSIKKHKNSADIYHKSLYDDYLNKLEHYRSKYAEKYQKLVDNLSKKDIEIVYCGDLADAIADSTEKDVIVYQNEFNSGLRAASNALMRVLEEDFGFQERNRTKYADIDEDQINYIAISQHQFMGRKKVFKDNRTCLYSNISESGDNVFTKRFLTQLKYKRLPDGYELTENSRLMFIRASMSEIDYLRMFYLKKDIILGSAPFCYLWFLDKYVIGACMVDFFKMSSFGVDNASLKSDFVIDSDFPKLSKLLLMGILSTEFKEEIDIRFKREINSFYTSVFTDKPVSMKYRGVFELYDRQIGKLHYRQESGKLGSLEEIIKDFLKRNYKK
ncbi:MAG: hypothetical protein A2X18_07620 [Bacteroidetes bacterium GWF2_40_14]|nr:MAG: hypothetical protein A2X18_07620 [Bacteroidetes bacterium GWF2_40_14]